jgi:3-oxoacyl-[acyl-carrier protein] reductase
MLLREKTAVVFGGGGAIGGAVARAFAAEGARVFLAGRTIAKVDAVARAIADAGGRATAAALDVLDEDAVVGFVDDVVRAAGHIDVAFLAIAMDDVQGTTLLAMPIEDVLRPIVKGATSHLIAARSVARRMAERGAGVILTITAGPPDATPLVGGFAPACGAIEHLWRGFAAELGPRGVRFICLRSAGSPDTPDLLHSMAQHAAATGASLDETLRTFADATLLKRLPMLAEVANMATLLASDRASALTGTFVHVTCGSPAG